MPEEDEGYSVIPAKMAEEEMIGEFTLKVGMETGADISDLLNGKCCRKGMLDR